MGSKPDVFMPVFIGDVLKHIARLDRADIGSYFLLLLDYWIMGAPPNDDVILARIARCTAAEWLQTRPRLEPYFRVHGGHWRQKRVEEELEKAIRRKAKGAAAANRRWGDSSGHAPSIPADTNTPVALTDVRAWHEQAASAAGDALASMATHPGIASIAPLRALMGGDKPCDWELDIMPAITSAAAWHRDHGGAGSMRSWKAAERIAVENRDRRLAGPGDVKTGAGHGTSRAESAGATRRANLARAYRAADLRADAAE